ncbi:envelope stress sensor histidine kinase CpxA, partial [Proteus mirabilis]|nr:envelope stress sensor histidine kinase CpxA [Proteus mirabilis]
NELWNDILDNAKFEAEHSNKTLTVTAPPGPSTIYCNPYSLASAFENIVRNALRYSHSRIEVAFTDQNQGITIIVDDDGPG